MAACRRTQWSNTKKTHIPAGSLTRLLAMRMRQVILFAAKSLLRGAEPACTQARWLIAIRARAFWPSTSAYQASPSLGERVVTPDCATVNLLKPTFSDWKQSIVNLIGLKPLAYCTTWRSLKRDGAFCFRCCGQAGKCVSAFTTKKGRPGAASSKHERSLLSAA